MRSKEVIYDTQFNMAIDKNLLDEIKKRALSQKRSLSEIARSMFEMCIKREDEIVKNMYKKDKLDPEDVVKVKELQIDFGEFMKDWMESIEARKEKELNKENI